jgi:hypothetical protein
MSALLYFLVTIIAFSYVSCMLIISLASCS